AGTKTSPFQRSLLVSEHLAGFPNEGIFFGGAVLVCLASAAFGAGFVRAFTRSQKRFGSAKGISSGIALAGKALCIGSLCSIALAGGAVFGTCKLLGISKVSSCLKKGETNL
ncbi:hypothetical protein M513_10474, partial [Trichuris suis]